MAFMAAAPCGAETCATIARPQPADSKAVMQAGSCLQGPCSEGMCYIPPGEFIVGAASSQIDGIFSACRDQWGQTLKQEPLLKQNGAASVYLNALCVDRTEVTRGRYGKVMGELPPQPGGCKGDGCPAVGVTWNEAARYCAAVQKRLPTEQEWEKAARGALGALYPWGDDPPDCGRAHTADCGPAPADAAAHPGGASPFGILNAAGNAAEWTADCFDPNGGPDCARTVRGGAWYDPPWRMLAFFRIPAATDEPPHGAGFRCATNAFEANDAGAVDKPFAPEVAALASCIDARRRLDERYSRIFNEFVSITKEMLGNEAMYMGAGNAALDDLIARAQRLERAYEGLSCGARDPDREYETALKLLKSACGNLTETMRVFHSYFEAGNSKHLKTYNINLQQVDQANRNMISTWETEQEMFGLKPIEAVPVSVEN